MTSMFSTFVRRSVRRSVRPRLPLLLAALTLSLLGCTTPAIREAQQMAQAGQHEAALAHLNIALQTHPEDSPLRMAWFQQRETTVNELARQVETAHSQGRSDEARIALDRLTALAPQHPRTASLQAELQRQQRVQALVAEAEQAMARQQWSQAELALRAVLGEVPQHPQARTLLSRIESLREAQTRQQAGASLKAAQRVITLEFREAPLRTVFEALAKAAGVGDKVSEITERAMAGELDFAEALKARVALLAGLDADMIQQCLHERVRPMPGAETLVRTMTAWGAHAVLVDQLAIGIDMAIGTVPQPFMCEQRGHRLGQYLSHRGASSA